MSSAPFLDRWLHRKPAPATEPVRLDVRPPDLWPAREPFWTALRRWLAGPRARPIPRLQTPLERARTEFIAAMDGMADPEAADLLRRTHHARSLRELWHLRSELYTLICRRLSQPEADQRLARVNAHFPSRTTRAPAPAAAPMPETLDA